jgi:hypothetical protein
MMHQSLLSFENGRLRIKKKTQSALDRASKEWTKSDLDDICLDSLEPSPDTISTLQSGDDVREKFSRKYKAQSRLGNQNGLVVVRKALAYICSFSGDTRAEEETNMVTPKLSLLNLPVEIRLCICRHLLVSDTPSVLCPGPSGFRLVSQQPYEPPLRIHHRILETCKQINREATPILYSENVFRRKFYWPQTYSRRGHRIFWPLSDSSPINKTNFECISRIRLFRHYDKWLRGGRLRVLDDFTSLRELQVHIDLNDLSGEAELPTLCKQTLISIHRGRPDLPRLRVKIRQLFDHAYRDWRDECISGPMSFSLHMKKRAELEEWMKREGIFVDKRFCWLFETNVSQYCGPDCTTEFVMNQSCSKTDRIKCCINNDGEKTFSSLSADSEDTGVTS